MFLEDRQISNLFKMTPQINIPENIKVAKVLRFNTDNASEEFLENRFDKIFKFLKKIPFGRYKQITIGKGGYLKYPHLKHPIKEEFLRKMEKYVNEHWNIRERKSYLLYEDNIDETVLYGYGKGINLIEEGDISELKKDLAEIFQGTPEYPFGKPLYKWKYGFKIGDKYAIGLINYNVSNDLIKYATDFLNLIDTDFISILHFENMDALQAEKTISNALSISKKTGMPSNIISQLDNLYKRAISKEVNLVKFAYSLYIFADSEEEAIKKAYQLKSIAPFNLDFEGNIEFENIFILSDFNYLKGKEMTGIVRKSTVEYLATMFYCTGRFNGKPEAPFIPALNECLEPAYIPIDKNLFNLATQGQMGSGKSVFSQYLATMFDSSLFIEKIQSDVGSYAVFCNYFDGEYIPISLEVPVSINPLGKGYEYFSVDVFDLARTLGIDTPHKYLDENEREGIALLLNEEIYNRIEEIEKNKGRNNKEKGIKITLTKEEIKKILEGEKRAIRLLVILEEMPEDFVYEVKFTVNPVKKTFINTFLTFVYKGADEKIENFSEVSSLIEKVVDEFYKKKFEESPSKEILISELYTYIEKEMGNSSIKERLLARLYSFKEGGKYGHLFDKPTNIRKDVDHIFFEVRFSDEEVIPIAIMTIMDFINNVYGSVRYREKLKMVTIDEGWFFMKIELAKNFIDEAFRTYRKRGIGITFATQNPEDFEGMTNYFPYVAILYLEDPESAVKVYKLKDRDYHLLKSIDKPKAYGYKYSKIYMRFKNEMGKTESGLFIIPSYPEFRWIAETDPFFKLKREEAILKTGSLRKAIEFLAFNNSK